MIEAYVDPIIIWIIRGGLLDTATLLFSLFYATVQWLPKRSKGVRFLSAYTGLGLVHGLPMLPLILLILGGFGSDAALYAIVHTHRVILGIAGGVALFSIREKRELQH
jgi:hypothetical protein